MRGIEKSGIYSAIYISMLAFVLIQSAPWHRSRNCAEAALSAARTKAKTEAADRHWWLGVAPRTLLHIFLQALALKRPSPVRSPSRQEKKKKKMTRVGRGWRYPKPTNKWGEKHKIKDETLGLHPAWGPLRMLRMAATATGTQWKELISIAKAAAVG